jgi:hypothetical protein
MTTTTISALPNATVANSSDVLPIVQSGVTKQLAISVLFTNPSLTTPVLGTPQSGSLANCSGLPIDAGTTGTLPAGRGGTGVTSLGSGVATFLQTPSSANLAAAVSDETGTGALVFSNSPTLVSPNINQQTTGAIIAVVQNLNGNGTVDVSSLTTAYTSTSIGNTLTLPNGTLGQIKNIVYVAETAGADTAILTPVTPLGYSTITFNDIGDSVMLQYFSTGWAVINVYNAVVA